MSDTYRLHGANPSPYSQKMRALMRYRRLPFVWDNYGTARDVAITAQLPPVIPVLRFPDGTLMNNSTPLAYELERRHPGRAQRHPARPGLAFLSDLIEDFGDEWVTKMMFHYRWYYADDRKFAQTVDHRRSHDRRSRPTSVRPAMTAFNDRQVGRMAMVGCTEQNKPIIEESYFRLLDMLNRHVVQMPYLFGSRPALADFGLFGQLIILATDPTPDNRDAQAAPPTCCCGCCGSTMPPASRANGSMPTKPLPTVIPELLRLAADVYLPFLAANFEAMQHGDEEVSVKLLGPTYAQAPFRYQAKCYDGLKKKFAALPREARRRIRAVAAGDRLFEVAFVGWAKARSAVPTRSIVDKSNR